MGIISPSTKPSGAAGGVLTGEYPNPGLAGETVARAILAKAISKLVPVERGRSAAMVSGKVTIAAPATTASNTIIVSAEGATIANGLVAIASRSVGVSFTVESSVVTSTDIINWIVFEE